MTAEQTSLGYLGPLFLFWKIFYGKFAFILKLVPMVEHFWTRVV